MGTNNIFKENFNKGFFRKHDFILTMHDYYLFNTVMDLLVFLGNHFIRNLVLGPSKLTNF